MTPSTSEQYSDATHTAWTKQLAANMAQLTVEKRSDWDSIKQVIRACETELFEPDEQFSEGSLLADSWYTLLLQQLKISHSIRLCHDDLCAIRRLLRQYRANDPATLERVHRLTYRAEDLFHSRQLVQSECIMSLFRPPKAVRQANQRQLITTRVMELLTQRRAVTRREEDGDAIANAEGQPLAQLIADISEKFGVSFVLAQDLFNEDSDESEDIAFPSVVRSIPGLPNPFSGALRPIERTLSDDVLIRRIRRARREYRHPDHFRDVLYLFYSASLTALQTPLDRQLPDYFRWLQKQLKQPAVTLISDIHARAAYGGESFVAIAREVAEGIEYAVEEPGPDQSEEEIAQLLRNALAAVDWSRLVVGEYDLVRLLAEHDSDVPHGDPQTGAMLARLI